VRISFGGGAKKGKKKNAFTGGQKLYSQKGRTLALLGGGRRLEGHRKL